MSNKTVNLSASFPEITLTGRLIRGQDGKEWQLKFNEQG